MTLNLYAEPVVCTGHVPPPKPILPGRQDPTCIPARRCQNEVRAGELPRTGCAHRSAEGLRPPGVLAGREGHCSLVLGDELDFAQEAGRRHQSCLVGHGDLAQAVPTSPGARDAQLRVGDRQLPLPEHVETGAGGATSCVPGVPRMAMRPSQTMTSLSVVGPGTVTSVSAPLR